MSFCPYSYGDKVIVYRGDGIAHDDHDIWSFVQLVTQEYDDVLVELSHASGQRMYAPLENTRRTPVWFDTDVFDRSGAQDTFNHTYPVTVLGVKSMGPTVYAVVNSGDRYYNLDIPERNLLVRNRTHISAGGGGAVGSDVQMITASRVNTVNNESLAPPSVGGAGVGISSAERASRVGDSNIGRQSHPTSSGGQVDAETLRASRYNNSNVESQRQPSVSGDGEGFDPERVRSWLEDTRSRSS